MVQAGNIKPFHQLKNISKGIGTNAQKAKK